MLSCSNTTYFFFLVFTAIFVTTVIHNVIASRGNQYKHKYKHQYCKQTVSELNTTATPSEETSSEFSKSSMSRTSWFSQLARQNKNSNDSNSDSNKNSKEEGESEGQTQTQQTIANPPLSASAIQVDTVNAQKDTQKNSQPLTVDTKDTQPKYFSGQYEYEVSPTTSPTNTNINNPDYEHEYDASVPCCSQTRSTEIIAEVVAESDSNANNNNSISTVIMERMVPATKTVFLIRHAQSDENRRLASLTNTFKGLIRFKLPQKSDIVASVELLNISAQIDSDVSPEGKIQIDALGIQIEKDNFVEKMGIQLVAHSPLKRARQTSDGMLNCVTPSTKPNVTLQEDYSAKGRKGPSVQRVVELPVLSERTPLEWLPVNHDAFTKRIAEFEAWLGGQPEDVIAIVGHSQYFKSMLGLPKKFKNVDVWSLQFDSTVQKSHADVKMEINTKERIERGKKLKKKLDTVLNAGSGHGSDDGAAAGSAAGDGTSAGSESESDNDGDGAGVGEKGGTGNDSEVFETANEIYEIDGVRVDHLELPRGWRDLKRHYTFDPSMLVE